VTIALFWHKSVFIALTSGLVLSPLAFGGSSGWFTNVFAAVAGTLALLWSAAVVVRPEIHRARLRPVLVPICLVGGAILWCFAQASLSVSGTIAPAAWGDAARLLAQPVTPMLSANPEASLAGAMRLTGYAIVFLLCYQFARDEARALRLLRSIAAAGAIYAAHGICLELTDSKLVLWFDRTFEPDNLSSTFPNRNAFASYATLCLICGLALFYRRKLRHEDMASGWRRASVAIVRYYFRRNGWLFYAAAVLVIAILWTHSRAGLATTIVAFVVFIACAASSARRRWTAVGGGVALVAGIVAVLAIAGSPTTERFGKIPAASAERLEIFRLTIDAISDRPLLGTGLGTFADVFPAYRSAALRSTIDFAHDSYLENALEMGLPAAIVFYSGLVALFLIFLRALISNRGNRSYPALGITALSAEGFHSLFDYAAQFPAVAILLSAMLAIAAAQSVDRHLPVHTETHLPERRI
jgi:O-antigen ligase